MLTTFLWTILALAVQLRERCTPSFSFGCKPAECTCLAMHMPMLDRILSTLISVHKCRFPLEQAPEAFKALLSRQVMGKILLLPDTGAQPKL